jgi:hypothetical protein
MKYLGLSLIVFASLFAGCEKESEQDDTMVFAASGEIANELAAFKSVLGEQLTTPEPSGNGRREINWDGIPQEMLGKPLPSDFFNPVGDNAPVARQRGLTYAAGQKFVVSNTSFSEINGSAANQFQAFSGDKTFANVGSNLWDVAFQVPGKKIPAATRGFGIVFSDVDKANSTFLEFFDGSKSIGRFAVPVRTAGSSFSFLGVYFRDQFITHVKVMHDGHLDAGTDDISNGGTNDLIVMDDFIYGEPIAR